MIERDRAYDNLVPEIFLTLGSFILSDARESAHKHNHVFLPLSQKMVFQPGWLYSARAVS